MANNSEDQERGHQPLGLEGVVGLITLLKSLRVISAEVRIALGPFFWCALRDRSDPGVTLLRLEVGP